MNLRCHTGMKVSSLFFCVFLMLFNSAETFSQSDQEKNISGMVLNEKNEPLELVNVFISNTTIGSSTDENGKFEFTTRISGRYDLVFSIIGYKSVTVSLDLNSGRSSYEFEVTMEESTYELDEISVSADNREWQRNYNEFKTEFLGTSLFARETEIKNPWVLDFVRDQNRNLIATAYEPLEIVNMALGYMIYAEIEAFNWSREVETGFFSLNVKYEELKSNNLNVLERWEQNRRRVYQGSFEHFLHSLYENRLASGNFEVVRPDSDTREIIREISREDLILHKINHGNFEPEKLDELKGFQIRRERIDVLIGRRSYRTDNRQRAILVPANVNGIFILTKERVLSNPLELAVGGDWARYRLADKLPVDYYFE